MAVVLVATAALTVLTVVVLVLGLIRRLSRLNASILRIRRDLLPFLAEVRSGAEEAQRRANAVAERAAALAPPEG